MAKKTKSKKKEQSPWDKYEWLQNIALLIVVWAFRLHKLTFFHNYEPDAGTLPKYQIHSTLGMGNDQDLTDINSGYLYATEDIEINYEFNIAVVSIGFRSHLFDSLHNHESHNSQKASFQGVYIYHDTNQFDYKTNQPIQIEIPESNPHGIDIFKISDEIVRIFVVSHKDFTDPEKNSELNYSGEEEIIYFDYNVITKSIASKDFYRVRSPLMWASNDVVALSKNSFIVSQFEIFGSDGKYSDLKNMAMSILTFTDWTGITFIEFEPENEEETSHNNPGGLDTAQIRGIKREKVIANYVSPCNGLKYDFKTKKIYVNHHAKARTAIYNWNYLFPMESAKAEKYIKYEKGILPDNLSFSKDGKYMFVSGFNNLGRKHLIEKDINIPSVILKVDMDDHSWVPILDDPKGQGGFSTIVELSEGKYLIGSPGKNLVFAEVEEKSLNN